MFARIGFTLLFMKLPGRGRALLMRRPVELAQKAAIPSHGRRLVYHGRSGNLLYVGKSRFAAEPRKVLLPRIHGDAKTGSLCANLQDPLHRVDNDREALALETTSSSSIIQINVLLRDDKTYQYIPVYRV